MIKINLKHDGGQRWVNPRYIVIVRDADPVNMDGTGIGQHRSEVIVHPGTHYLLSDTVEEVLEMISKDK